MSELEGENQGLFEAHTPPASDRAAKIGAPRAAIEDAVAGLRQQLQPDADPEQQSLLLADPDEDQCIFEGPVKHVASILGEHRRGRGRPKGSQNRASKDLAEYLLRMGFRDPALNLAAMANADPYALAVELSGADLSIYGEATTGVAPLTLLDMLVKAGILKRDVVIGLIAKAHDLMKQANAELLPYFHSKKAQTVDLPPGVGMGVMIIGEMRTERPDDSRIIDITNFPEPE